MNHRIVSAVVGLIVALLVATALAFALSVQARVPASAAQTMPVTIPHPISARNDACTHCHSGAGVPLTHRHFTNAACPSCHSQRPITLVPHSVSMGNDRCATCHGDPDSDYSMPSDHLRFREKRCLFCHDADGAKASTEPTAVGVAAEVLPTLTHPVAGAFAHCLYCHRIGSQPTLPRSHQAFGAESCGWCHVPSNAAATAGAR